MKVVRYTGVLLRVSVSAFCLCRNGGINSSLDSSKDDSFTDIDVESVDNPKELLASEGRPPLNNVTTNINNGSSNGVGGGKSVDNNVPAAPATAPAANVATPAVAAT